MVVPATRFTVYIFDSSGRCFQTNVSAESHEEAASAAARFFLDPDWHGPKPRPGTRLRVSHVYGAWDEREIAVDAAWCAPRKF